MAGNSFEIVAHKNSSGMVYVDVSDVVGGLYRFANFTRAAAKTAAREAAIELEASMKRNAPWNDRTGNARRGLKAEYFEDSDMGTDLNVGVRLSHSVYYGVFLEYNGLYHAAYLSRRRPILVPTMKSKEALVLLSNLQKQFSKIAKV